MIRMLLFLGVGLAVGIVGRQAVPWKRAHTLGWSMGVGVAGAFQGAALGHLLGYRDVVPPIFVASALGAAAAFVVYQLVLNRPTTR